MENILGLDSNLENDFSSDNITESLATSTTIDEPTDIIPKYASEPQNLEKEDNNQPKPDNFLSAINSAGQTLIQNRQADISKPTSYYNPETKERYKSDPSIYHDHFNPQSDNEKIAYENWDKWDALSAGWSGFKDNFSTSFEEYFRYDRIAKALFNLDSDYLAPTEGELDIAAYKQHLNEIKNPIYYAPNTESDILTKGFLAESIANLGFTFGTISGVVTEQIGAKAIEAGLGLIAPETGGASLVAAAEIEAAADVKAAVGLGKVWKNLTTLFTGKALNSAELVAQEAGLTANVLREGKAVTSVDDILQTTMQANNAVASGVKYGTKFWDNALKVASKVPFAGELADAARIYRAGKGILTTKELFQLGVGGFRRSLGEWQLAASEASVEAGGAYKDHVDQLIDIYEQKNNTSPIGQDLLDIKEQALKVSTADFGTNVAILGIMNKIQWGNLFGKFKTDSKVVSGIRTFLNKEASDVGVITVKRAGKIREFQKNSFGAIGLFSDISKEFGSKKIAAWEVGKDMLRGLTRVQISEGIQENLQEMASVGIRDYYTSIYKNDPTTWGKSFDKALESQASKQGFKTFLSGALTGLFIGPSMHVVQEGMQAFDSQAKAHKEAIKNSVKMLNKFYESDSKIILKEAVKNIKLQNMYNEGMIEGITTQDKKQYNDNKDSALIQTIMHAKRTGTLGNLVSFVRGYSQFSESEFKEAFNFSPEELGKSGTAEVMNDIANAIEEYSDIYDNYQTKFGLYLGMEELIKDPLAREKFSVKRAALLDYISTVSFIQAKSQAAIKRQASMRQNLGKYKSIGNSLNTAFSTLVSPEKMDDASFILQNEIKSLKESLVPELDEESRKRTLRVIDDKENELGILNLIKSMMFKIEEVTDPNDPSKVTRMYDTRNSASASQSFPIVSQLISEYLQIKNRQAGLDVKVDSNEIEEAMKDIYDYMALGQDYEEYVDAVNFLNKPETFGKHLEQMQDARVAAHARLLYDEFERLAEISSIGRKFKEDNQEILDQLLSFSRKPAGTYQNMLELQKIRELLNAKADEIDKEVVKEKKEKQEAETKAAEEKAKKENYERIAKAALPLDTMLEEAQENASIMQEIDDYLKMRYDSKELENFPFNETDPKKRIVNRYFVDMDGNKILLDKRVIPTIIPGTDIAIDNIDALYNYLCLLEEAIYNQTKATTENTGNAKTQEKTEQVDNEKSNLANHVGNPVMFDGEKGTLEIEDNNYVVKFPTGKTVKIAEVKEGEIVSFDDFNELSPAYESLDEETKSQISPVSNSVVDTNHSGTVTIAAREEDQDPAEDDVTLDQNLNKLYINGVAWDLIKDENGLVIGFERTWKKKKGKGTVLKRETMSVKKGKKGADYAARVNVMLTLVMRKMPQTIDELVAERNALENGIAEAQHMIASGGVTISDKTEGLNKAKQKSDERLALYRLNKIKDEEIPDDILQIKTKFDHPFKRNQVSHEDMLKLFMWASELVNKIKGDVIARRMISHPVIWNAISELTKDYINPISNILDGKGRKKSASSKVTKRSAAEEKSTQKLVEEFNARTTKPGVGKPTEKPKKQRVRKKKEGTETVKEAVETVENQFDSTQPTTSILNPVETETENQLHNLSVDDGVQRIQTITPDKINMVMASVKPEQPTVETNAEIKADIERRKKISAISDKDGISVDGMSTIITSGLEGYYYDANGNEEVVKGKDLQDTLAKLNARYDAELAKVLYLEMMAGKTNFTPEEQRILNNPEIIDKAAATIDFGDVVQANIKGTIPEVDKTPDIPTSPSNENPFSALLNNFSCKTS